MILTKEAIEVLSMVEQEGSMDPATFLAELSITYSYSSGIEHTNAFKEMKELGLDISWDPHDEQGYGKRKLIIRSENEDSRSLAVVDCNDEYIPKRHKVRERRMNAKRVPV